MLKARADFKLIGTSQKRVDVPDKVDGSARYGIDTSRVLAIGDDDNDVSMIDNARVGLAIGLDLLGVSAPERM